MASASSCVGAYQGGLQGGNAGPDVGGGAEADDNLLVGVCSVLCVWWLVELVLCVGSKPLGWLRRRVVQWLLVLQVLSSNLVRM